MVQSSERKVLRIGLMKDGKLIEEKLLRKPDHVTIGQSNKCTFTLPVKGLPSIYPLFRIKGKKYHLMFHQKMQGKINIDRQTLSFREIESKGLSQQEGPLQSLPLSEDNRGKIEVGDLTLLFQFLVPPPIHQTQKIPDRFRKKWFESMDWVFLNILTVSTILQFSTLFYLVTKEYPPKDADLVQVNNKFSQIEAAKKKKIKPPPPEEKPKPQEEKKVSTNDTPLPKPDTPENKKKRRNILRKKVIKGTVLQYAFGNKDGTGNIIDGITSQANRDAMDSAFDEVGIAVASNSTTKDPTVIGATNGEIVEAGNDKFDSTKPTKVRTSKKKKRLKAKLKMQKPSEVIGTGTLSNKSIGRTVNRRKNALKGCYEAELKKDDSLKGKIKVQFTIETSGRVSTVKVIQNTMGSQAVASCIRAQIKRWRFRDKPQGGSVTVAYPFVFTPSR